MPRRPTAPKEKKSIKGKEKNEDDNSTQKIAPDKLNQQKANERIVFSVERKQIIHISEQPEFRASKRMAVNITIAITW